MSFDTQFNVHAIHAPAIIYNPHLLAAPVDDINTYASRTGIETVLHKFLDHGSRAFDHLPRCDLAHEALR
jgi:hypothetical protein